MTVAETLPAGLPEAGLTLVMTGDHERFISYLCRRDDRPPGRQWSARGSGRGEPPPTAPSVAAGGGGLRRSPGESCQLKAMVSEPPQVVTVMVPAPAGSPVGTVLST
ncbi:hypothetical protein GCM10010390_61940 [Streptomyces mordarskii]|uniref:Uncharacterized protein n=1 Tax=Streptomyces mordarskii TaxID=1226758 RepID=A0ABN1DTK1_9ACTN